MMKYVVMILSALFVIISCTPKDRTARINEIYEELEKEVADETKDESKTPDENIEPDDEQVEEDVEIIDEISDEDAVDDSDVIKISGAICTGQTKCYNETEEIPCPNVGEDFYGQDAQYAEKGECKKRSFSDVTNMLDLFKTQVFKDDNTNIIWLGQYYGTYAWQDAKDYCKTLKLGESLKLYNWRLSSLFELGTLINYGRFNPSISTLTAASEFFWTATNNIDDIEKSWAINFESGIIEPSLQTNSFYLRCVSGEELLPHTFVEKTISEKVVFEDSAVSLMWTKENSTDKTWKEALNYCENLEYAGFSDWRLPNINELKTLIDHTKSYPASSYSELSASRMWTSSTYVGDPVRAWCVAFSDGSTPNYDKTVTSHVVCVRNGE